MFWKWINVLLLVFLANGRRMFLWFLQLFVFKQIFDYKTLQNQWNSKLEKMSFHIYFNYRCCALLFFLAILVPETEGNHTETDITLNNGGLTTLTSFRKCCPRGQVMFKSNFCYNIVEVIIYLSILNMMLNSIWFYFLDVDICK